MRVNELLVVFLATSLELTGVAAQPSAVERTVLDAQAKRNQAMMAEDVKTLDSMLADELFYCHASALQQTKAEFLKTVREEQFKWLTMVADGVAVHVYGNIAVVTTSRLHETITAKQRDGKIQPVDLTIRTTEVYVNRDDRWQLTNFQATRVPEPTPPSSGQQ